jgi:MoaA/NifB/PqqE/SkfB family radical SAM enzyme
MRLEEIGFYTLSEERARTTSTTSPLMRVELLITDRCNLKCPYCRGVRKDWGGEMSLPLAQEWLSLLGEHQLKNVRFSGGEPLLYPALCELVRGCVRLGVERIAISTNGTAPLDSYKRLVDLGVNDFSISLDAGCCAMGEVMSGGCKGAWEKAVETIREISNLTYVTVGVVLTEVNVEQVVETVRFVESLGPSDIRVIPSAQYNKGMELLKDLSMGYPIFKYRLGKTKAIRGLEEGDSDRCSIVLDDLAIYGQWHFPCVIYFREGGEPIGKIGENFRRERKKWLEGRNSWEDEICRRNCLDVCKEYNNRVALYLESK